MDRAATWRHPSFPTESVERGKRLCEMTAAPEMCDRSRGHLCSHVLQLEMSILGPELKQRFCARGLSGFKDLIREHSDYLLPNSAQGQCAGRTKLPAPHCCKTSINKDLKPFHLPQLPQASHKALIPPLCSLVSTRLFSFPTGASQRQCWGPRGWAGAQQGCDSACGTAMLRQSQRRAA